MAISHFPLHATNTTAAMHNTYAYGAAVCAPASYEAGPSYSSTSSPSVVPQHQLAPQQQPYDDPTHAPAFVPSDRQWEYYEPADVAPAGAISPSGSSIGTPVNESAPWYPQVAVAGKTEQYARADGQYYDDVWPGEVAAPVPPHAKHYCTCHRPGHASCGANRASHLQTTPRHRRSCTRRARTPDSTGLRRRTTTRTRTRIIISSSRSCGISPSSSGKHSGLKLSPNSAQSPCLTPSM
jgi:hypothetical protein